MAEYTDFGRSVKQKLDEAPRRTGTWLCAEVRKDTGLYVDSAYLSKILTGHRNPPKVIASIRKILDLPTT